MSSNALSELKLQQAKKHLEVLVPHPHFFVRTRPPTWLHSSALFIASQRQQGARLHPQSSLFLEIASLIDLLWRAMEKEGFRLKSPTSPGRSLSSPRHRLYEANLPGEQTKDSPSHGTSWSYPLFSLGHGLDRSFVINGNIEENTIMWKAMTTDQLVLIVVIAGWSEFLT